MENGPSTNQESNLKNEHNDIFLNTKSHVNHKVIVNSYQTDISNNNNSNIVNNKTHISNYQGIINQDSHGNLNHTTNQRNYTLKQSQPQFHSVAGAMEKTDRLNRIADKALDSIQLKGEFIPTLETSNPFLDIHGPLIDKSTGATYKGQLKDGLKSGYGKEIYEDGSVYEGNWKNGKRNGQGRFVGENGDLFQGEFSNNMANGDGCLYTYDAETTYTGTFVDDVPHGKGKEEYKDGSFYIGDFKKGEMTGKCKYVFKDGGVYTGDIVRGEACGHGDYTYINSNKTYSGAYKHNKKHGFGTLTGDKYIYTGEFEHGKINGYGQFVWNNGKSLEGTFINGRAEGIME